MLKYITKQLPPAKKLPIKNFYSKLINFHLYRSYIPMNLFSSLPYQNIERRSNLSLEEFIREYDAPCRPVIITDITKNWPASTEWTIEKFMKKYGYTRFKTDEVCDGKK